VVGSGPHAAAAVLGAIGPQAKAAVPTLIEARNDESLFNSAIPALRKIDPETAEKITGRKSTP
jgi:hypothetical protein